MPAGRTPVWDVGVGGGTKIYGKRGNVMIPADTADPLPRLQSRTFRRINYGAHTEYTWDRSGKLLELVAIQSDGTYHAGL